MKISLSFTNLFNCKISREQYLTIDSPKIFSHRFENIEINKRDNQFVLLDYVTGRLILLLFEESFY